MQATEIKVLKELGVADENRLGTTSSSPFLGSPTFDETPFHVNVGKKPALNTYVVIETDDFKVAHYGRVIEGTEDNPRADPSRLQQNQAYRVGQKDPRPGDQDPRVTRVMTAEILGEVHLNGAGYMNVKEPGLLPQTGKGVYELPADRIPWLLDIPSSPDGGLHIGLVDSGTGSANFVLPMEAMARHIGVVGKTGVGKSYAVGVLMEELAKHNIPIISFGVLGDTLRAAEDLEGKNYRAGEDFSVPYSVVGLGEFLGFVPNLTRDQSELVALAYESVFDRAFGALNRTGTVDVPLENFLDEIRRTGAAFGQDAVGQRAARRVEASVNRTPLLSPTTGAWLKEALASPMTNVFVGHLGQRRRNLIVGATARMLQALRSNDRFPPFVFVLDEAHLFLPAGGETTPSGGVIRELVRTARHIGIGMVIITQSPSSMDRQVLLTCNTRMVFSLDRDDLRTVSGTMGDLPEQTLARIPKLAKGNAVVSSGMDIIRHPASVRIRKRKTREGAPTPNLAEEVKRWREQKNG